MGQTDSHENQACFVMYSMGHLKRGGIQNETTAYSWIAAFENPCCLLIHAHAQMFHTT
jgi:hypothetical protein